MAPVSALLLLMALAASLAGGLAAGRFLCGVWDMRATLPHDELGSLVRGLGARVRRLPPVARVCDERDRAHRDLLFRRQMPDVLRLLCIALESGSSLVKALEYTAENAEAPLSEELKRTVWDLQVGQGFDEAMAHLRARTGAMEFAYLAVAMEVQHRSGGSLTDVLKTISESLRGSAELAESLRTQTEQGRLSARIVAAMPLAIVGVFALLAPSYLGVFFSSPLGVLLLLLALALEAAGVLWVRRSLAIDFSAHLGGGAV